MKKIYYLSLIAVLIVSCKRDDNAAVNYPHIDTITSYSDAGELHNECLDKIFSSISDSPDIVNSRSSTPFGDSFIREMANIQLAVLDGTDLSNMTEAEITTFIRTSVETSVSPEVITLAHNVVDTPQLTIISSFEPDVTLSPIMRGYMEDIDEILISNTLNDAQRNLQLLQARARWHGTGNEYENTLMTATFDIILDSKSYWNENANAWAETMGVDSSTIKRYLWRIARADGWALARAFYNAGWYYGTMFWKEMLIASGVASAVSVVKGIITDITLEVVNGQTSYRIGDLTISELDLENSIIEHIASQRPGLYYILE